MKKFTSGQANSLLLLAALIWGSAFVPQAWGAVEIPPFLFTGLRFLLGTLVVAPLAWWEWQQRTAQEYAPGWGHLLPIAGLGLLIFIGVVLQQIGLAQTSVTNAGVLTALYVPLTPFLAWVLLRHRPDWKVWPAALACLLGTWLLAGGGKLSVAAGDWWVIASSLFWALHVLLVGRVSRHSSGPFMLSLVQFAVCAVASLLVAAVAEPWPLDKLQKSAASIAYTGLVSVGLGYTLQVIGQRHANASHAAIILSSETLFAALFGAWLMGDRLSPAGFVGCGLILGSILLMQIRPRPTAL